MKDLFRKAGNVVRADVALSYDNRSKGHGTVLFNTVEDAQRAIGMRFFIMIIRATCAPAAKLIRPFIMRHVAQLQMAG